MRRIIEWAKGVFQNASWDGIKVLWEWLPQPARDAMKGFSLWLLSSLVAKILDAPAWVWSVVIPLFVVLGWVVVTAMKLRKPKLAKAANNGSMSSPIGSQSNRLSVQIRYTPEDIYSDGSDILRFPVRVQADERVKKLRVRIARIEGNPSGMRGYLPFLLPVAHRSDARDSDVTILAGDVIRFDFVSWRRGSTLGHLQFHRRGAPSVFIVPDSEEPLHDLTSRQSFNNGKPLEVYLHLLSGDQVIQAHTVRIALEDEKLKLTNIRNLAHAEGVWDTTDKRVD